MPTSKIITSCFILCSLASASASATTIQRVLDYDFGRALERLEGAQQTFSDSSPITNPDEEWMEDPGEDENGEVITGPPEEFPEDPYPAVADDDCQGEGHDHFEAVPLRKCQRATKKQRAYVNLGNKKQNTFIEACNKATRDSAWCQEILRPNPDSRGAFACTYGWTQPHMLIHPNPKTWKFAFEAVKIADELFQKGIHVCAINNWWRPEPYNRNVG